MPFSPKRAAGTFILFASLLAAAAGMGVASTPAAHQLTKVTAKASVSRPAMVIVEPSARPTMHPILPPCEGPIITWPQICFIIYG